ncbi:MAG TPA: hypothetical protein VFE05_23365 [Longimicrobiaceae bacterium]|nr:hypothetical protein [Longimicrobiaceae bacterium]
MAIARELLPHRPAALVISGLTQAEAEGGLAELRTEPSAQGVELSAEWGDVFVPHALKDRRRAEILADPAARALILEELYAPPADDAVERSALGHLLLTHRPDLVVDCINTATVFAYQNMFASASGLLEKSKAGEADNESVERHLATLYLPQLIRHAQIALDAMKRAGTRMYLKIGTAGTGGMGLNIPFTHSEERPSRVLLAKSSLAGAHTLLLYLMARTPGAPAVKEIKPTAAISWKRVGFGEVKRAGKPIRRVDSTVPMRVETAFDASAPESWSDTGEALTGVFLDAGENGLFSPPEFETLTALGLMEFITPEEIAANAVREVRGHPTGRDVIAALDASTSGPTYRAGVLRESALARMDELEDANGVSSIAYEMLGPPRLAKLLFEGAILSRLHGGDLGSAASLDPAEMARAAEALVTGDADLRTRMLSIGLPVLLADGARVLRGGDVKVRPEEGEHGWQWAADNGWVDLRAANWERWRGRLGQILQRLDGLVDPDGGSRWDVEPWERARRIRPGALAAWIFRYEDGGERIKR